MKKPNSKLILWQNVSALMHARYGRENLTKLASDAKIGPATASRIKQHETSVGIDVVESIAKAFKVDAWQLLVPGFDAAEPPVLATQADSWPFPEITRRQMQGLPVDKLAKIEGYIERILEDIAAAEAIAGNRAAA
jgi:transcriptional regulator with XRE-family HTH domain